MEKETAHNVTPTEIYGELKALREDFHALDKKVVEQNHIKSTLSDCKDCLVLLTDKVEDHDKILNRYRGRSKGKEAVGNSIVQWIPVIIMTAMLVINIIYNGGG